MEVNQFTQNISIINNDGIALVIKIFILIGFLTYFIFSSVVTVQIKRMFETFSTGAEAPIFLVSIAHMSISLIALLWAFMVL